MPRALTGRMGDARILEIGLDEGSVIRRSPEIERERQVAIDDLTHTSSFRAASHPGPYRLLLRVEEGRLAIEIGDAERRPVETVRLGLARFRRPIREYFAICESYFAAVRTDGAKGIETIDMARRAIHNDAAELLRECLDGRIAMDFDTARRLFTLICVLHIR